MHPPRLSRPRRPPRPGRPSLPFHIHSEQLKKIAFDPAICTSFPAMRSVLGAAKSTVLKYMIQSHELRTPLNAIIGLTEMMVKIAARFGTEKAQEPL